MKLFCFFLFSLYFFPKISQIKMDQKRYQSYSLVDDYLFQLPNYALSGEVWILSSHLLPMHPNLWLIKRKSHLPENEPVVYPSH